MELDEITKKHLNQQLIKLGDMIGDGLHLEPGNGWINKEYKAILRQLGYAPPRKNNTESINSSMQKVLENTNCSGCSGKLKQTRSGSMRAKCVDCGVIHQFKRVKKKRGKS